MFYKADAIDLVLVDLGPELYRFHFLTANDRTQIVLADTHDKAFGPFADMEDLVLLPMDFFDGRPTLIVPFGYLELIALLESEQFAIDLIEQ